MLLYLYILYRLFMYYVGLASYVCTVKSICTRVSQANIFYVKVFQWFTQTACQDVEELRPYFNAFKNNVAYTDEDIDYDSLIALRRIARENQSHFTIESYSPINSGTVALIFKGTLNGKPVIIKIKRKNIYAKLDEMFKNVIRLQYFTRINIAAMLNDVRDAFFAQLDFDQEVQNISLFYQKYRLNTKIIIPKVYPEFTAVNDKLIVMDSLVRYDQKLWTPAESRIYCRLFTKFIVSSYFLKEIYHGDLHQGNIVFMKTNGVYTIGIIDFGVVGHLDLENQNFIYNLFVAFPKNNYVTVINLFTDYVFKSNNNTDAELKARVTKDMLLAVEKSKSTDVQQLTHNHIYHFLSIKKYGLVCSQNFHQFLFSLLSMTDTMKSLMSPDKNDNTLFDILNLVD